MKGETLQGNNNKGYGVIFVDDYPLSFYKESNNQVKNLFPKGLRR
jgi:NOL1/NOP2/fmu family ribosome biogenesis protein